MAARVPTPTPKEIAARAKAIRATWTPQERKKKCVYSTDVRYTPMSENVFSDSIGPSSRRIQKLY
jgi:hypothetical protein